MAAALAFQLQRLEAMRKAGQSLSECPQLGLGRQARGLPGGITVNRDTVFEISLYDLLHAYGGCRQRVEGSRLEIVAVQTHAVEEAIQRMERMIGRLPGWQPLMRFLPRESAGGVK